MFAQWMKLHPMNRYLGGDDYTDLTEQQEKALDYVERCIEDGLPPTRAEIAEALGFKSTNAAQEHLIALEKKGRLQLLPGKNRGIKLLRLR